MSRNIVVCILDTETRQNLQCFWRFFLAMRAWSEPKIAASAGIASRRA
jgi:hypothetical protein